MSRSLVIVESPAKAKTINKYLGSSFVVEASLGHVKDLPKGGLSIDVDGGFVPTYQVIDGKKDVIERLKNLAGNCEHVYLATDPDREGEAIAHHIAEEIRARNGNISRVVFHEITKTGVTNAMRQPRQIDRGMVEAQEARRVMDRLIGYKVSPYLWRLFSGESRGLSAGRVQSVALRLVVEREKAINSFIPIEYWSLLGHFTTKKGEKILARLVRYDDVELRNPTGSAVDLKEEEKKRFISTQADAERIRERALREAYHIETIARKEVKRNAPPPFTTSTLQQDAGRRLKMSSKRVMELAQKLYEGQDVGKHGRVGLITYMRTDSVRISDEAAAMAEEFIFENYGKEYLTGSKKEFKQKGKNVQDAHEAIRPTDLKITPKEARKSLDKEMADLYELVWSRFVASQMAPAIIDQTTVDIQGGPFLFRATGRITRFKGWMQVYADDEEIARPAEAKSAKGKAKGSDDGGEEEKEDGSAVLPEGIKKGDDLGLEKIDTRQSFTKPPPRYTESLLVKEMEGKGIGRPSTYASIISTIQDRGYVEQKERKLYATELGIKVSDALVLGFPALFDVKFTAKMEGDLDTIATGNATYLKVMQGFYTPFQRSLNAAAGTAALPAAERERAASVRRVTAGDSGRRTKSDVRCGKCGSAMELRDGKYGPYLACLGFPACRNLVSANADGTPRGSLAGRADATAEPAPAAAPNAPAKRAKSGSEVERAARTSGTKGGVAGAAMPAGLFQGESDAESSCKSCGSPLVRRRGKSGDFLGCSNYPTCRYTQPIPLGIMCPLCGKGDIAERMGGRYQSVFYGCTRYPDCRFTSSHKPVNRNCSRCHNGWMVEAYQEGEGTHLECPKCKSRTEN